MDGMQGRKMGKKDSEYLSGRKGEEVFSWELMLMQQKDIKINTCNTRIQQERQAYEASYY